MHTHYQDDLLLKHIADAVGYSVQHLNRLFHHHYGVTGHQYMQRLRLQKASERLDKHPGASVREAAETVGMEVNYFIRMFKREFGETPGKGIKHRNQLQMGKVPHEFVKPLNRLYTCYTVFFCRNKGLTVASPTTPITALTHGASANTGSLSRSGYPTTAQGPR